MRIFIVTTLLLTLAACSPLPTGILNPSVTGTANAAATSLVTPPPVASAAPATGTSPSAVGLQVNAPAGQAIVTTPDVTVAGSAVPGAVVSINDDILLIGSSGQFMDQVPLVQGLNVIEVIGSNTSGDEQSVELTVSYQALTAKARAPASPAAVPTPAPTAQGIVQPAGTTSTVPAALHSKPHLYRGTIGAVSASSLDLTLSDASHLTIGLTPDVKILTPGSAAIGGSLALGMQASVLAFSDQNNALVVQMIAIIPPEPVRAHRVGKVTAYTPGARITIQASDGTVYNLSLDGNTRILTADQTQSLAVGSLVTVVAPRVPSSQSWTAIGIVLQPAQ